MLSGMELKPQMTEGRGGREGEMKKKVQIGSEKEVFKEESLTLRVLAKTFFGIRHGRTQINNKLQQ